MFVCFVFLCMDEVTEGESMAYAVKCKRPAEFSRPNFSAD